MYKYILFIFIVLFGCSQPPKENQKTIIKPMTVESYNDTESPETDKKENVDWDQYLKKENAKNESDEELKYPKEIMAKEIVYIWEMFFNDQGASPTDPRREMFQYYAEEIAESIEYFKLNEADIGGKLPDHRSTHLMIAEMITRESSVNPHVVGKKKKEVSMFQMHGEALGGYPRQFVRKETGLAALLGVRWIAHHISLCSNVNSLDNWTNEDWVRPISAYGAGIAKTYKNKKRKTCKKFTFAKRRVKRMKSYALRIDIMKRMNDG